MTDQTLAPARSGVRTAARAASVLAVLGLAVVAARPGIAGPRDAVSPPDAILPVTVPEGIAVDDAVRPFDVSGIDRLVAARPFRVDEPFRHHWRAERPFVSAGWLLVVETDAESLRPTQLASPVLYAGGDTAARLNVGSGSGRLVIIVPDDVAADGGPATDLSALPIWFGDADLPERITAAGVAAAAERAARAGVRPRPAAERAAAIEAGMTGELVAAGEAPLARYARHYDLLLDGMRLVRVHAPDEQDLADGWLIPAGG